MRNSLCAILAVGIAILPALHPVFADEKPTAELILGTHISDMMQVGFVRGPRAE